MPARRLVALVVLALAAAPVGAAGKKSDSVVKAKATAGKVEEGKQVVTITLEIDPRYHLYGNPVGVEDLEESQTTVRITGKGKPQLVKVTYPEGEIVPDKAVGDYRVYKGKITITAVIERARGDDNPLDVAVKVHAFSLALHLLPATIQLSVP